jgi:hypothetical protein
MIWSRGEQPKVPGPELLAAYADGELPESATLRKQVADWLASHPEAAAELAAQAELRRLWQATTPADPGEAAWEAVRSRVAAGIPGLGAKAPGRGIRRRLLWAVGGLGAAAALLWLALTGLPPAPPTVVHPNPPGPGIVQVEPLPVATEDEVQILQVRGADTGTVVVGSLPVRAPLELAGPGDVTLKSVQSAPPDNMVPDVRLNGPSPPMIWSRLENEPE